MLVKKPISPSSSTLVAPCEGRAHENVLLPGEAVEECVERGEQDDVDRGALAPGQRGDVRAERAVERRRTGACRGELAPAVGRGRSAGADARVRPRARRASRSGASRAAALAGAAAARRRSRRTGSAAPAGSGRAALDERAVELGELAVEHPIRRCVERDVVDRQQQDVSVGSSRNRVGRSMRSAPRSKPPRDASRSQPRELCFPVVRRDLGQVDDGQLERPVVEGNLDAARAPRRRTSYGGSRAARRRRRARARARRCRDRPGVARRARRCSSASPAPTDRGTTSAAARTRAARGRRRCGEGSRTRRRACAAPRAARRALRARASRLAERDRRRSLSVLPSRPCDVPRPETAFRPSVRC